MSTDNNNSMSSSSSLSIWQNVCLASAWFSRAQQASNCIQSKTNDNENVQRPIDCDTNNNVKGGGDDDDNQQQRRVIITFAERSLSLYQSCYKLVKKEERKKYAQSVKEKNCTDKDSAACYTINLELRMAQTLRFLAHLHSNYNNYNNSMTNNDLSGDIGDETVENNRAHDMNNDIETAIKYHDMAVSLLVGVYDDDDDDDEDENDNNNVANDNNNISSPTTSCNNSGIMKSRDSPSHNEHHQSSVDGDDHEIWSVSAADTFSESQEDNDNDSITNEAGGRVMLTMHIPNNTKLNEHIVNPQGADHSTSTTTTSNTIATFVQPTESQRVRAIATSLNALAELHAMNGNDRAAMDSYREALEILRAATEENNDIQEEDEEEGGDMIEYNEEEEEEEGGDYVEERGGEPPESSQQEQEGRPNNKKSNNTSNAISPIQIDLANTLMNVGNFHLRRDELDAALNAYSTVWALHSGTSLDDDEDATATNVQLTPSTPSNSSVTGSTSVTSSSVPYLTPQQQQGTSKSVSQSSFNTPNSSNNNGTSSSSSSSSSLRALVALNNLGIVHERRNELSEATSCFEHVYQTRTAILGQEHSDTLNALINLSNVYQRLQDWDKAGISYEEIVNVYKRKMVRWHNTMMNIDKDKDDVGHAANKNTLVMEGVKLHHSLAGTLRNFGTCYWKQRRISEAIDKLVEAVGVEEQIVTLLSSSSSSCAAGASVRRAKGSMAQLLGLLGCLYLEYKLDELKSYDKSKEVFQRAIQIYSELGYDTSHPSVVWAYHNLGVVEQQGQVPPPPPPPPPVTSPSGNNDPTIPIATPLDNEDGENKDNNVVDDVVDLDDIDSVELDRVLATDDENTDEDGDDIFLGVETNSTDELDAFLNSGEGAVSPTNEEVVDRGNGEGREGDADQLKNRPLSNQHRNFSATFLNEQGDDQEEEDDDLEERLSQLQLQAESDEGDNLEAAHANVELADVFWSKGDRVTATQHLTEAHSIFAQLNEQKEVAMVLKKLGDLNKEDKALDAAKELYQEALEIEIEVYGQYLPQTLNAAGQVCLLQEDFRQAMDLHRQALQIQKHKSQQVGEGEANRQDKYEMYETLVRIGNVYYSERNNYNNIQSNGVDYREFIESGFLGWIANAHDMRGEYIKAINFYEESYEIQRSRKGKDAKREMALTLNRLGSLTRELGRYDEVSIKLVD